MHIGRVSLVAVCTLAACGASSRIGSAHAPTASPPATRGTTTSSAPSTTAPAKCTNGSVIAGWPLQRRASFVLVAPVLNFDITTVRVAAQAGAGGILFLGGGTAPTGLAGQLRSALSSGAGPAPIAMADQEGGGIQRLTPPVASMPWPRTMAATMSTSQVEALLAATGQQMRALDVGMDLAPVADLDAKAGPSATDPDGQRSFSADPTLASRYTLSYAAGLERGGVIPVVKHFPGLGGTTGNTDYGPAATPPLSTLESSGLAPFKAAIAAGEPAIMISNASVPGLTSSPASLSPAVVAGLLRTQLGFNGLVLTDSVSAGAITAAGYDVPKAAVAAISAGDDMVLFGSTLTAQDVAMLTPVNVAATLRQATSAVVSAVDAGTLPAARLDAAVQHIVAAQHLNLCGG